MIDIDTTSDRAPYWDHIQLNSEHELPRTHGPTH
jgi:hypothetical protein